MTTKLFDANECVILFSRFIDKYEINILRKDLQDLIYSFVIVTENRNGVGTAIYNVWEPEINVIADLLYYLMNFVSKDSQTMGQSLCSLCMYVDHQSSNNSTVLTPSSYFDRIRISLCYALLSYIIQRKEHIFNSLNEIIIILFSSDNNSINNNQFDEDKSPTSIFKNILIALKKSIMMIGVDTTSRLNNIVTIIEDINTFFFAKNGRYLDIALRMNNTRLLSPHIINNYKLKALSWLMGFRLLLLAVYSSRVVANEIDKQVQESHISNDNNNSNSLETDSNNNNINNNITKKCFLCIDQVKQPCCVPCGHIYCWDCIMDYCNNNNGTSLKCPLCRTVFKKQSIRALFNY